jgi:hypothetical protein
MDITVDEKIYFLHHLYPPQTTNLALRIRFYDPNNSIVFQVEYMAK